MSNLPLKNFKFLLSREIYGPDHQRPSWAIKRRDPARICATTSAEDPDAHAAIARTVSSRSFPVSITILLLCLFGPNEGMAPGSQIRDRTVTSAPGMAPRCCSWASLAARGSALPSLGSVEHLQRLMEESNLTTGGHVLFVHYQQGMSEYLGIALLQHRDGVTVNDGLEVKPSRHLDLSQLHLVSRINLSEWHNNKDSRQCVSIIKGKSGRKLSEYFRDFIGCQEGVNGPGETRTLLKAFSDFIEHEDLPEEAAREKTNILVEYATAQTKLGEPVASQELSELLDEDRLQNFAELIHNADYGLSAEIPANKRTINQFRRFTGRADGLSISFEAHLLDNKIEFAQEAGTLSTLMIKGVPTQLVDQPKRPTAA